MGDESERGAERVRDDHRQQDIRFILENFLRGWGWGWGCCCVVVSSS